MSLPVAVYVVLIAAASVAGAAPFIPESDSQVLEHLPFTANEHA